MQCDGSMYLGASKNHPLSLELPRCGGLGATDGAMKPPGMGSRRPPHLGSPRLGGWFLEAAY
ncbi:hypothetical protein HH1059_09580 [Halorhodospira halochloris]|uniref:Uncharacterized protein n=1 Tax=Halorhodospira halochloris TaxID=1052 RepID=A0A2Z6EZS3_HALHR|nr:hypothetical protein HH1059_09580 [Halorhodospira halochloris]